MCDCDCSKAYNSDKYLDIKNWSCKQRLFGKSTLACEDEILNTTETRLVDKIVTCENHNCLIYTISLVILCSLLLFVISISCYQTTNSETTNSAQLPF